ncbi:DNA polymerase family X [Faustovirus]|nr:DNA polymerase family X [Faustovirus]
MDFVSISEACKYYKVKPQTLRLWAKKGKIEFIKEKNKPRRYKLGQRPAYGEETVKEEVKKEKLKIIYGRVSSRKQSEDLERQVEFLKERYPNHQIKKEIGSGANSRRKEFRWILQQLFEGNIEEVIISYPDRWTRTGYEFFEWLFTYFGAKLVYVEDRLKVSKEQKLTEELMGLLTSYTAKIHGRRKYRNKKNTDKVEQKLQEII